VTANIFLLPVTSIDVVSPLIGVRSLADVCRAQSSYAICEWPVATEFNRLDSEHAECYNISIIHLSGLASSKCIQQIHLQQLQQQLRTRKKEGRLPAHPQFIITPVRVLPPLTLISFIISGCLSENDWKNWYTMLTLCDYNDTNLTKFKFLTSRSQTDTILEIYHLWS